MPDSFSKRQRERNRQDQQREKADKRRARQTNKGPADPNPSITVDEAPAAGPGFMPTSGDFVPGELLMPRKIGVR